MPWAPRSVRVPEARADTDSDTSDSDESTGSRAPTNSSAPASSAVTTARQNESLFQQLAAAHAAQQKLEERLETQKREADYRLREQKRVSDRRIAELEKDLNLCQKREGAIKDVFFDLCDKQREWMMKEQGLEKKEQELNKKSYRHRIRLREFEEKELELEDARNLLREAQGEDNTDDGDEDPATAARTPGQIGVTTRPPKITNSFSYGKIEPMFTFNRTTMNAGTRLDPKDKTVIHLRKHDYYAGWLDAMRSIDHQKSYSMVVKGLKRTTHRPNISKCIETLHDNSHPKNPKNAGINAGLMFAWSALCREHNMPQHDMRLDDRVWKLEDLVPVARNDTFGENAFWEGLDYGVDKMKRLFKLKLERGIWKTGEDAAQIVLMSTRDMRREFTVVRGERGVRRPRHPTYSS